MNISLVIPAPQFTSLQSIRWMDHAQHPKLSSAIQYKGADSAPNLFRAAKGLGLAHTLSAAVEHELGDNSPSVFRTYLQLASLVYRVQRDCWLKVQPELCRRSIPSMVLKGLCFVSQVYHNRHHYLMNDIDCIVHPDHLPGTREALEGLGYSQRIVSNNGSIQAVPPEVIADFEGKHYELFPHTLIVEAPELSAFDPFIREYVDGHPFIIEGGRYYLAVEIDVHHNLSHGFELDHIWENPQHFKLGDLDVAAPNPSVFGWFLPARFYHEVMILAERKSKLLADLAGLVVSGAIDYSVVLSMASRYTLESSLWYVYRFLREELGFAVPAEFLQELHARSKEKPQYRDWGDFLPKLIGKQVTYGLARD